MNSLVKQWRQDDRYPLTRKILKNKIEKLIRGTRKLGYKDLPILVAVFIQCEFHLLIYANEWINKRRPECVISHLNIPNWFTRSHPLKGGNCMRG